MRLAASRIDSDWFKSSALPRRSSGTRAGTGVDMRGRLPGAPFRRSIAAAASINEQSPA
jgi:hypothetical protein